jgi:hypothetical protein
MKNGTSDQIKLILNNLQIGLSENFAPEYIDTLVEALKQESGRTSVKLDFASIDVSTKAGFKGALQNLNMAALQVTIPTDNSAIAGLKLISDAIAAVEKAKQEMVDNPGDSSYVDAYNAMVDQYKSTYNNIVSEKTRSNLEVFAGCITVPNFLLLLSCLGGFRPTTFL